MKLKSFLLGLVASCMLMFAAPAKAQLNSTCFTSHYSKYTTMTPSADHAQIVQTVTVSGYVQTNTHMVYHGPQVGWVDDCAYMVASMRTATHTLSLTNMLGTVGGNYSQGPTPALSNQTYTISVTANLTPGTPIDGTTDGNVICIVAGNIFAGGLLHPQLEGAGTYDQATGAGTPNGTFMGDPVYTYNVVHYCTNGTPDYNPSTLDVNEPNAATDRYFFATAVLFRFFQTSTWSVLWPTGGATVYGGSQPSEPPTPCTHTGPQM